MSKGGLEFKLLQFTLENYKSIRKLVPVSLIYYKGDLLQTRAPPRCFQNMESCFHDKVDKRTYVLVLMLFHRNIVSSTVFVETNERTCGAQREKIKKIRLY